MNVTLSQSAIVREVAETASRRIARKAIAHLQQMKDTLSGDDSELKTTWDEICVQVQGEHSFYWDVYEETVRSFISAYIEALATHEREAIWLQTRNGIDWDCDDPDSREPYPVFDDDIVDYIITEYLYAEADRWSNSRIREFLDRTSIRD